MKSVLSKIAQIQHEVKLANIGDLDELLRKSKSQINEFLSGYAEIETTSLKIYELGEETLDTTSKLLKLGAEIASQIKQLGLDPNKIPEYAKFQDFKDQLEGDSNQIEDAMDLLDKVTARM